MAYATVEDVQRRMTRTMDETEESVCENLLEDAAVVIDAFAQDAEEDRKSLVSCRMVMRALGDGSGINSGIPMGASQGSNSALGYSQSWTMSSGASTGELYLSRLEKQLLGIANRIGSYSPVQELVPEETDE